jgi:hypothetical protein
MVLLECPSVVAFVSNRLKSYDGSHDLSHALRVMKNAMFIYRVRSTRSRQLVLLCAFAHDACDHKYGSPQDLLQDLRNECMKDGLSPKMCEDISTVVANISFSKLKQYGLPQLKARAWSAWKIVSEADLLESLGTTGIIRTLMYQGYKQRPIHEALEYIRILYACVDFLQSDDAKEEGRIRLHIMKLWMDQVKQDMALYMLCEMIYRTGLNKLSFDHAIQSIQCVKSKPELLNRILYHIEREHSFGQHIDDSESTATSFKGECKELGVI